MPKGTGKKLTVLLLPLLAFFVLYIPYNWVNQTFLVDWLGCGCPVVDEYGNVYERAFNANDFTACFWLAVTLGVTASACFLCRRISRERWWLRVVYIAGMLAASLWLAGSFYYSMQWN
ncbi:MAG: hypothetical protein IJ518_05445 [Clostridia bacterium]|nr:hypothetical protein [Clostridia bacterium]